MVILKSVFLLIIFSNQIFAKDFDDLFKITIEIKNENIENSIDRAFNDLVFRLIGYEDLEKAMANKNDPNYQKYLEIREKNLHKMNPIPVCKFDE